MLSVNKTMSRVLLNKIPNTSGNGFKIKRDIPEEYSNIFDVDTPLTESEGGDEDLGDTSDESEEEDTVGQTLQNVSHSLYCFF